LQQAIRAEASEASKRRVGRLRDSAIRRERRDSQ